MFLFFVFVVLEVKLVRVRGKPPKKTKNHICSNKSTSLIPVLGWQKSAHPQEGHTLLSSEVRGIPERRD